MEMLSPGQNFGRYRIQSLIGRGGMGEIYLALGPGVAGCEKRLAIKRLLPAYAGDAAFVARFLDEAHLVMNLTHGNIVPVFEAGQVGREYFLAMEYVDGRNLREIAAMLAQEGQPFPVALAVLVAHEVCRGLDYAHRKADLEGRPLGIIHRDVSPHNVLVSFDGEVRLADFGIAKATGRSQRTFTGSLLGKFAYMSPEQAMGLPLDGRSDLFSLGAVLHELLTGRPLFDGESDPEVLRKVQEAHVLPPSALRPEVPPELDRVVLRMLARDPGERFPAAAELERHLGALRYAFGVGAVDLGEFLVGLFPDRRRPILLTTLAGPDALPQPQPHTATLLPEEPLPELQPRRWSTALFLAAVPLAALAGYLLRAQPAAPKEEVALPRLDAGTAPVLTSVAAAPPPVTPSSEPRPESHPVRTSSHAARSSPRPAPAQQTPATHEAPQPAEPPPQQPGTLSLRVNPWGEIAIDGVSLGQTAALVRHPLAPGTHMVEVRNEPLGREARFEVQITSGENLLRKVDFNQPF